MIGIVIGTHAAKAYIALHLESRERNYPKTRLLINDDCSNEKEELAALAEKYGAEFTTNEKRFGHYFGDVTAFYNGLLWAQKNGLKHLVKFSRRFLPTGDFTAELESIFDYTDAPTVGSPCERYQFGLRTEAVAMQVAPWLTMLEELEAFTLLPDPQNHNVEAFMFELTKRLFDSHASEKCKAYFERRPKPDYCRGFADWPLVSRNKDANNGRAIWHDTHSPSEYVNLAKRCGLNYAEKDFVQLSYQM